MPSIDFSNFADAADVKIVSKKIVDIKCPRDGYCTVEGFGRLPIFYHCQDGSMDEGRAFEKGDNVLVLCRRNTPRYVIGHVDGKAECLLPCELFFYDPSTGLCYNVYKGGTVNCGTLKPCPSVSSSPCNYSFTQLTSIVDSDHWRSLCCECTRSYVGGGYRNSFSQADHGIGCGFGAIRETFTRNTAYGFDQCERWEWSTEQATLRNRVKGGVSGAYLPSTGKYVICYRVKDEDYYFYYYYQHPGDPIYYWESTETITTYVLTSSGSFSFSSDNEDEIYSVSAVSFYEVDFCGEIDFVFRLRKSWWNSQPISVTWYHGVSALCSGSPFGNCARRDYFFGHGDK